VNGAPSLLGLLALMVCELFLEHFKVPKDDFWTALCQVLSRQSPRRQGT
jgi:hypothetical protein